MVGEALKGQIIIATTRLPVHLLARIVIVVQYLCITTMRR